MSDATGGLIVALVSLLLFVVPWILWLRSRSRLNKLSTKHTVLVNVLEQTREDLGEAEEKLKSTEQTLQSVQSALAED